LGIESVSNSIAITDIWWGSIFDGRKVGPVIVETKHLFYWWVLILHGMRDTFFSGC